MLLLGFPRSRLVPLAIALVLVSGAVAASPAVAHADPARDSSRVEFSRGVTLVQQGDYPGARDAFATAYRLYPHPSILLNLGIAQWKTGQYVESESSLVKFLADYGDASAENVASARSALREVRAHLGSVRLVVTTPGARVTFDDRVIAVTPGSEVVVVGIAGDHDLRVEADRFSPRAERIHLDVGDVKPLSITLDSGGPTSARAGAGDTAARDDSLRPALGWTLLGMGGAAAIAGSIFGVRAIALADDYNHHGFDPSDKSTGTAFRTLSDVTFATALVTGSIGAYLLFTTPNTTAPASASFTVHPTHVLLTATF